jgi:hypothetical protein
MSCMWAYSLAACLVLDGTSDVRPRHIVREHKAQVSRSSRCRLACTEVIQSGHFNLPAVPEKSRSEKEKSGVLCVVSHAVFVSAHMRTRRRFMAHFSPDASRKVVWPTGTVANRKGDTPLLGGAAAPVMVEPGLQWRGRGGNRDSGGYDPESQGNWLSSQSRITNGRLLVSP